jgi:hypothetical protein
MLSAAVLVVILTTAAEGLGPRLSGVLTPFPVAVAIMSAFTHAQADAGAVTRFLRGFLPGLATFAVFCLALAVAVTRLPVGAAFAAALVAQMATQAAVLSRS